MYRTKRVTFCASGHKFAQVLLVKRTHFLSLHLTEALQQWTEDSIRQMSKALGRELDVFRHHGFRPAHREIFVKRCRILGTDQCVPYRQCSLSKDFINRYPIHAASKLPVDITWSSISRNLDNVVTVGDVQELLSDNDKLVYELDLIRTHLLTDHVGSVKDPFYFCPEIYC